MRREFVKVSDIELYWPNEKAGTGGYHFPGPGGKLAAVSEADGKTLEEHLEGIAYFKKLSLDGVKIFPPLVLFKEADGKYHELDGFKRLNGMIEAGQELIECFVATKAEWNEAYNYDGKRMQVRRGGQAKTRFGSVEYGEDAQQSSGCGRIINLFVNAELKIEYRENIHVHWGPQRLALGRRDFELLARTIIGEEEWERLMNE